VIETAKYCLLFLLDLAKEGFSPVNDNCMVYPCFKFW